MGVMGDALVRDVEVSHVSARGFHVAPADTPTNSVPFLPQWPKWVPAGCGADAEAETDLATIPTTPSLDPFLAPHAPKAPLHLPLDTCFFLCNPYCTHARDDKAVLRCVLVYVTSYCSAFAH